MKKVILKEEGAYEFITIGGAVVFAIFSAIGLGYISPLLISIYVSSIPFEHLAGVGCGIGCWSFPIFSAIWWGILNTFFSRE